MKLLKSKINLYILSKGDLIAKLTLNFAINFNFDKSTINFDSSTPINYKLSGL